MQAPVPIAIYIDASPVTLPLDGLPDKVLAGFMCPLCSKVHGTDPGIDARADAAACCWCERHNERRMSNSGGGCVSCLNEESARWHAQREVERKAEREAAYAMAKPWEGQEIAPVDWEDPNDVHEHPDALFDDIADREYPNPVTLDDLPVMAYVVKRRPLFDASEVAHEALGHEIDVSTEAVNALQVALDAWSAKYGFNRVEPGEIVRLDAEREAWWAEYLRENPPEGEEDPYADDCDDETDASE